MRRARCPRASKGWPRDVQGLGLSKGCQKAAQELPKSRPRGVQGVSKGCSKAVQGPPKGCPRAVQGLSKGCPSDVKGCPSDVQGLSKGCPVAVQGRPWGLAGSWRRAFRRALGRPEASKPCDATYARSCSSSAKAETAHAEARARCYAATTPEPTLHPAAILAVRLNIRRLCAGKTNNARRNCENGSVVIGTIKLIYSVALPQRSGRGVYIHKFKIFRYCEGEILSKFFISRCVQNP